VIPREVLTLIEESPHMELPGIPTREHECQGSKFHSPRPMVVHPFPMPHTPGEMIYLCGTCSDNVRLLLALEAQGEVPWTVKRCFGNLIRAVAATTNKEKDDA
jgi:hypothetical protein